MPRKQLETHFFYGTGDDEIQVDSNDRKFNKEILKLKKQEPEISVPAEKSIWYDGPQIEIPDTGSKKPFLAAAVGIIGIGAVFALALI